MQEFIYLFIYYCVIYFPFTDSTLLSVSTQN